MYFDELDLNDDILDGLDAMNFSECTPIQEKAIPVVLEGNDILASAHEEFAMYEENLARIKKETSESIKQLSGNIILTGGGAKMDGVIDLAKSVFRTSAVRLGIPEILGNETSDYRSPEYATAIGIVENAFKEPKLNNTVVSKKEYKKENKLRKFFKTFF